MPQFDLMPQRLVPVSLNVHTNTHPLGITIKSEYFGDHLITTSYYEFKKVSVKVKSRRK